MCKSKVPYNNFQLVTIAMAANQGTYNLGNEFSIRNAKKVKAVRFYYTAASGYKSPDGVALMNANAAKTAYLKIFVGDNEERISRIPLLDLAAINASGYPQEPVEFDLPQINPSKCQVIIGDVSTVVAGEIIQLGFVFDK